MDSTKKFSKKAKFYTAGRPAYAKEFIDELYSEYGFTEQSVIADIGSGTGKLSKQLLDRGSTVYGVEPNGDMRKTAEKELGEYRRFSSIHGTDSYTGIEAHSVDFVTVAQAFHWFDLILFQKECRRILKKSGKVFLIWNIRDISWEINKKSVEIFSKYCPEFHGFSGGMSEDDGRIQKFFGNEYEKIEFENSLVYDKETFINRCLSGSYSLKKGDGNYEEYIKELEELYAAYEKDGRVVIGNTTVAYVGTV